MRAITASVLATISLIMAGCGGGGGGGATPLVSISSSGYLGNSEDTVYSSGMYMDQVGFTATRNGRITVTMSRSISNPIDDPQVFVVKNDANLTLVGSDDDSGEGLNASYSFTAVEGKSYYAWFSTAERYDSGSYTYTIAEVESAKFENSRSYDQSRDNIKSSGKTINTYEFIKRKKQTLAR